MKILKVPSLVLAAALQLLPLARVTAVVQQSATPLLAIIFRWAATAAAALGGMEAVSGASTVITSALAAKGTNGVPFKSLRLTTAPDQAHYWTASGIPAGLSLTGTSGSSFWQVIGTPTVSGTFNVSLTAKDQINSGSDRTVRGTLVLTIIATGTPPAITTEPQSQTVLAGQNVLFSVAATGTAPLTYQWKKDGTALRGATAATLTLSAVAPAQSGEYLVVVSNSLGSAASQPATLTVNALPPTITTQPQSQVVNAGDTATFNVAADGTGPLSYQWFYNDALIPSATASSLILSNATVSEFGSYSVIVSNSAGSTPSDHVSLTVLSAASGPSIGSQPQSENLYLGDTAHLSVSASGTAPLAYQWFFDGAILSNANTSTLTLTDVQTATVGSYTVQVSNSAGTVSSDPATLNVQEMRIGLLNPSPSGWQMTWQSLPGRSYQVEAALGIASNPWLPLSTAPAQPSGGLMSVFITNSGSPANFYRVRVERIP
jgi:hypothetical protein